MTVTILTSICPILTCLHYCWAIRTIPECLLPFLNPLALSQANLHLSNTLPNPQLPRVSSTHSWPNVPLTFSPSFCIKSIPDNSSISQLQLGEARSCTSLAQCVLVCPFLPSIYLFSLLSAVHSLYLIIHYLSSVSLFHPQFPISVHPYFIYLYSIPLLTLLSYPVLSLWLIPDCSDHPNPYHTLHLYKYFSYKLL